MLEVSEELKDIFFWLEILEGESVVYDICVFKMY